MSSTPRAHAFVPSGRPPVVLAILDGWGYSKDPYGNPTKTAKTPNFDRWFATRPWSLLKASGVDVGLPPKQAGNSEAGHLNIGAGRVVLQDSVRISRAISDGTFFKNPAFLQAIRHVARRRSTLHLFGMLTADQSAHADPDHIVAILVLLRRLKVHSVVLHLFTDGRDSPPRSALELLAKMERGLLENEVIGTVMGRFYAMDRKKAWERTRAAFLALTRGQGEVAPTPADAIRNAYGHGIGDEMVPPTIIGKRTRNRVQDGDAVIFYNLRSDRARQLTKAFVQEDFLKRNPGAFRRRMPKDLVFVAMTSFGPDLPNVVTAFPSEDVRDTLPMVLGGAGLRQLYLAESEKFSHITFFLNGGYDHPVAGEDRRMVPSPAVDLYSVSPVMSAPQLTGEVLGAITTGSHDFIAVNFANADMIGHTGDISAAEKALEVLDVSLAHIAAGLKSKNGLLVITADHGNVEHMLEPNGAPSTEHTANPVPFLLLGFGPEWNIPSVRNGRLADVAPTLLAQLGIHKPPVMTGVNLCPSRASHSS